MSIRCSFSFLENLFSISQINPAFGNLLFFRMCITLVFYYCTLLKRVVKKLSKPSALWRYFRFLTKLLVFWLDLLGVQIRM